MPEPIPATSGTGLLQYVVSARFGLDTGARSFPYVATRAREPKTLKGAMLKIQGISNEIIGRIEP